MIAPATMTHKQVCPLVAAYHYSCALTRYRLTTLTGKSITRIHRDFSFSLAG
jgi:hypothetical protein